MLQYYIPNYNYLLYFDYCPIWNFLSTFNSPVNFLSIFREFLSYFESANILCSCGQKVWKTFGQSARIHFNIMKICISTHVAIRLNWKKMQMVSYNRIPSSNIKQIAYKLAYDYWYNKKVRQCTCKSINEKIHKESFRFASAWLQYKHKHTSRRRPIFRAIIRSFKLHELN